MPNPAILLTGRAAGIWYQDTLKQIAPNRTFNIVQIDFAPINALLPDKLEEAALLLEPYFAALEQDQQPYILANITLHEAVKYFTFTPKYFISIADLLQQELKDNKSKVVTLGTKYTMNHSYIPSLIPDQVVLQLPPDLAEEVEELRKVYNHEGDPERSKSLFQKLSHYPDHNFVIACTELAMSLRDAKADTSLKVTHLPLLQCQFISREFRV